MLSLIVLIEAFENVVAKRNVADVHPTAHFAPKVKVAQPLRLAQQTPTESFIPTDRLKDKRGQYVQKIFIGDGEAAMQLVQAPEGPLAALAVIAPFQQLADNNIRVVVTLLGAL